MSLDIADRICHLWTMEVRGLTYGRVGISGISRVGISGISMMAAILFFMPVRAYADTPRLETAFGRMYQLNFDAARAEIRSFLSAYPNDALGMAAEAASYLFEQFTAKGILTSGFFLDDDRLLGGIEGRPDAKLSRLFLDANERARRTAQGQLSKNAKDANALLALTLADGMQGDFEALIEKHQLGSLTFIRRAQKEAVRLLELKPDAMDAYVAIGAADYIIGCLPSYKRVVLWVGGIHGDSRRGMDELARAATHGNYLKPLAKAFLALVSEREKKYDRAQRLFAELAQEFPQNPVFARELAIARRLSEKW